MKIENILSANIIYSLRKYSNLYKYAIFFYETNGKSECEGCLPNLIMWFKKRLSGDYDFAEFVGWDEDLVEDFGGYGSHEDWDYSFRKFLIDEPNRAMQLALQLAKDFGD